MARIKTPSFVLEMPLETTPADEARLKNGVFEAAKRINNALLQSGLAIVESVRANPAWDIARKLPKSTKEQRKVRGEAFNAVRLTHKFSDYDFQALAIAHKNAAGFTGRLDANTTQKLGTKVFRALERYLLGLNGQPRFKGAKRPLHSIEGKNNITGIRWSPDDGCVYLDRTWAIAAKLPDLARDEWFWSGLQAPVKYCRIVRHFVNDKYRYYLQLVMEGKAPMKASLLQRLADADSKGGIDIGPSNIGWATHTDAGFFKFCADVDAPQKLIRVLQRKVDRQNRANNPENFDARGSAKRGCKWVKSAAQRESEARLKNLHTHTAEKRVNAHGRDINQLLGKARSFKHDNVSVKSLQKNYGRSVGARAPGRFMSELQRKAERADGTSQSINVRQLKTSQYDHSTGAFRKKKLSDRWHVLGDQRGRCQRDVYSAFLALHVVQTVDQDGEITESHDRELLEKAWVTLEPVLRTKGLFVENESQSTGGTSSLGECVAPLRVPCELTNCNAPGFIQVPGDRARGAVRVKKSSRRIGLSPSYKPSLGAPVLTENHRPSGR